MTIQMSNWIEEKSLLLAACHTRLHSVWNHLQKFNFFEPTPGKFRTEIYAGEEFRGYGLPGSLRFRPQYKWTYVCVNAVAYVEIME